MRITSCALAAGILLVATPGRASDNEQFVIAADTFKNLLTAQDRDQEQEKVTLKLQALAQALTGLRAQRLAQQPTVLCGMTLIPADPKLDAKMRVDPPTGINPTIRTVVPQVCRDVAPSRPAPQTPRR